MAPGTEAPCVRDSLSLDHLRRLDHLRDSVEQQLRSEAVVPYERLASSIAVRTTVAQGCFGTGRTIIVSSLRAGAHEFVRERIVMVAADGAISPLRILGSRWRAHEAISAFDADGDGRDDLAMKGSSDRAGGTVIFKLGAANRLEKLSGGFNWETR
jgi:hypothetical protein